MAGGDNLNGGVALVTGASRGIGRAIAIELARAGADVAVLARSTASSPSRLPGTIDDTAREIEGLGRRALALPADITKEEQVLAAAETVLSGFGRLDLLVNNAAYLAPATFHETSLRRWDLSLAVNLRGAVVCMQAFLPSMIERGAGRIVNVSSSAADMMEPGLVSYAVSKRALETLTLAVANELTPRGIAVNALRIDRVVATEGAVALNPDDDYSGWDTPESCARAAVWLASQSVTLTGRIVTLSEIERSLVKG